MTLSNHATKRILERSKAASAMTPKQLAILMATAKRLQKDMAYKYSAASDYYLITEIDLVLVVNPATQNVITVYNYSTSEGFNS